MSMDRLGFLRSAFLGVIFRFRSGSSVKYCASVAFNPVAENEQK